MYVKQIVLEGFKSYRDRTVIGPFDPHFNAITGLNGSGKSNILDAICFVLGVTSLNTVRATCLGDLIYKGGGVVRASVSITFDNSDKSPGKCPIGYEKFPEIIVSRVVDSGLVCKYYLNSLVSTKNAVCDMFHQVGININHPNFIIMQGKITKVVNMKPIEVLQMIEETCGATAYQKKRDRIAKEIHDRERKVEGMEKVISDVIQPALEEQMKAQSAVQECHHTQRELNEKEKMLAVVAYLHHTRHLKDAERDLEQLKENEHTELQQIEDAKKQIEQQTKMQEELNAQATKSDRINNLSKELEALKRPHQASKAQMDSANAGRQEAAEKLGKTERDFAKEQAEIEKYRSQSKALIEEFESIKNDIKVAEENILKLKDTEDKLQTGNLISENGEVVNVRDQLNELITTVAEAKGKMELLKKETAGLQKSVSDKEVQLSKCPKDDELDSAFQQAQAEVERLDRILRQKQIDPSELPNLENAMHQSKVTVGNLERDQAKIKQMYPHLNFRYDTPTPNFNHDSVLGYFYEHFRVKDIDKFAGALEVAVGGSLAKMVVDNPETSKLLIDRGNLARRTTFIPLSATRGYPPRANLQAQLDSKFGPGHAFVALDLIEYEQKMTPVVQSIFGSTVITEDLGIAKKVAFELGCKAVSLQGDVSEPGGTMQGGTRNNLGAFMRTCQQLRDITVRLKEEKRRIEGIEKQLIICHQNQKLVNDHVEASRKLKQSAELRSLTTRAAMVAELDALKAQFTSKQTDLNAAEKIYEELKKQERAYNEQLSNESSLRDKHLKDTEKEKKKWEKALATAKSKYDSKQAIFKDVEEELAAKAGYLAGFQKDIDDAKTELAESEEILKKKQEEFEQVDHQYQAKQQELQQARAANKELEDKAVAIGKQIDELGNRILELEIAHMKRETTFKEHTAKVHHYQASLQKVLDENRGMEFSPDMNPPTNKSMEALSSEVKALRKRHEDMRVRLDFEKAACLQATKAKVQENQKMYKNTLQSKRKIEQTIKTLDSEKMKIVQRGYDHINEEFGTMMSILLPDSLAKLVPVNPQNLSDGLNIHVKLGGVWKESLTELSGGQRSLVALSLVLSLCMFNPAPVYVLDEIDAALDLSHTQNIGYLLRHKFTNTQFICVSLKDGMYTNANVLFQTQLLNGTSTVRRQTPGAVRQRDQQK